jgi:teichuronic acid biosynthesis glycosyltransferase TuaC
MQDVLMTNRTDPAAPLAKTLPILTFSTLFPNAAQPNHGIFVANRLQHLLEDAAVSAQVLAPVPWFPFANKRFGAWARYACVPAEERRGEVLVHHPRYPVIPRLGMSVAPWLLYHASLRTLRRLMAAGLRFDLIDAHYVYPDGVAAVWLARRLGKKVVITARGSDVTQLPDHVVPRRLIGAAVREADALISVSAALGQRLIELGAPPDRLTTLRNGVDTRIFHPQDRDEARASLGITGPIIISVGALIPRKAHHRTIGALPALPGVTLTILGEGPERARLQALAQRLCVADRVRMPGNIPHAELPRHYAAADVSVLASTREGWANVLLESMACGTPVVASDIPGNPEVVQGRAAGLIVPGTEQGIADGVRDLLHQPPDRAATWAYAQRMSWDETTAGQLAVFRRVLREAGPVS